MRASSFPELEAERIRNGLTMDEAAEMLGVCRKTYYNWSHGKIPEKKKKAVAEAFGKSVRTLFKERKS